MNSPELRLASKPAMFLNCLYKALKDDSDASRAAAFVKRALQVRATPAPLLLSYFMYCSSLCFSAADARAGVLCPARQRRLWHHHPPG